MRRRMLTEQLRGDRGSLVGIGAWERKRSDGVKGDGERRRRIRRGGAILQHWQTARQDRGDAVR